MAPQGTTLKISPLIEVGESETRSNSLCSSESTGSLEDTCLDGESALLLRKYGKQRKSKTVRLKGLTVPQATFFIIAEIAGSGLLTLPKAIEDAGWMGIPLVTICCVTCAYTGMILSKSWRIFQSRIPDEQSIRQNRYPYPALAKATFGRYGGLTISICVNFTLFGGCVVFLLLAANNIHKFVEQVLFEKPVSYCLILLLLACCLLPVCFCGTPKDFWVIPIMGMSATIMSMLLLLVVILMDVPDMAEDPVPHKTTTVRSFASSFGIICFAFTGHSLFLTVQSDMKVTTDFSKSLIFGYIGILLIYLPVPMAGYLIYGAKLTPNILETISSGPVLHVVQVTFTFHILMAFIILMNPICQELEAKLKISENFNIKRIFSRSVVMLCIVFVAETFPDFDSILSLIGGSAITILTFIFPSIIYLKLAPMKGDWEPIHIPLHVRILNYEIILVGAVTALTVTYMSAEKIVLQTFHSPCWLNHTG
ncbi:amino acid transporter AVT3B-like [Argonauta hians]